MSPHAEKAIALAAGSVVTGSIVRIYAQAAAALEDHTFGKFVENGTSIIYSSSDTDLTIAAGTYLEGPLLQCETKTAAVVVYYNGSLKVL